MILAVSGWRYWTDITFTQRYVRPYLLKYQQDLLIRVGDAKGLDRIVRDWLLPRNRHNAAVQVYPADWRRHGRPAGPVRNGQMLRGDAVIDPHYGVKADVLLAFPQPGSDICSAGSGTWSCVRDAFQLGIHLQIPGYKGPT